MLSVTEYHREALLKQISKPIEPENRLEYCKIHAQRHGGTCDSDVCEGRNDPMKWTCKKGHTFEGALHTVVRRINFCMLCKSRQTLSICLDTYKDFATKQNGKFLEETKPGGIRTPARWACCNGHEFTASLLNVRQRLNFCLVCAKNKDGILIISER